MHRSSSYYLSSTSSSSSAAASGPGGTAGVVDVDQLPTYDPQLDAAKKEALDASRANLAHALVHLVPVIVLLSGLLLWSLSTTTISPTEVGAIVLNKGRLMALRSEYAHDWNGSGMMTGTEDADPIEKVSYGMASKQDSNKVRKRIKKDGLKK